MAERTAQAGYVLRDRHPERVEVYTRYDEWSAQARALPCFHGALPYGDHPRERFDLFAAEAPDAPLVIFFHGGYWQSLDRSRFAFVGARLARCGFTAALPSYPLCPETGIDGILQSARRSLAAIFGALERDHRHPRHWVLSGHSAGGHIAAWLACAERPARLTRPAGCLAVSGIFDLAPLRETTLNEALGLTAAQAERLAPPGGGPRKPAMRLVVGEDETQEFHDQSARYLRRTRARGGDAEMTMLPGRNHYTIMGEIMADGSELLQLFARFR